MELPQITLPKVDLPFEISTLLHPAVVHFVIAIPVIILLLEFYNLFAKRKSIGAFSFILLLLTVIMMVGAFLTGGVDGKEAYDLLSPEGQAELKEHKLLGTYLIFASLAMILFKLLAMTGKKFFKFLFFITLIGMILITFKQGKDGGELVYTYGANVAKVKVLDEELLDTKEELEEADTKKVPVQVKDPNVTVKPSKPQVEAVPVQKATTIQTQEVVSPKKEIAPTHVPAEVEDTKIVELNATQATKPVLLDTNQSNIDNLVDSIKKKIKEVDSKTLKTIEDNTKIIKKAIQITPQ